MIEEFLFYIKASKFCDVICVCVPAMPRILSIDVDSRYPCYPVIVLQVLFEAEFTPLYRKRKSNNFSETRLPLMCCQVGFTSHSLGLIERRVC